MFNNIQEAQAQIVRIESYGPKITKAEKDLLKKAKAFLKEQQTPVPKFKEKKEDAQTQPNTDVFSLEGVQSLAGTGLKKKTELTIDKQQIQSILSAYKRTRNMGVQLEAAAMHGNKDLFGFMAQSARIQQANCLKVLGAYASTTYMGRWMSSIHGLGPVVSSMLVAEIDPEKQRYKQASHLISFAGLNPNMKWNKGEKRPFSAELKLSMHFFSSSQLKWINNPNNYYGRLILAPHMEDSWRRNLNGGYEQAAFKDKDKYESSTLAWAFVNGCFKSVDVKRIRELARKDIDEDGVLLKPAQAAAYTHGLYKKYMGAPGSGTPMLSPAHLLARSQRFVSVVFLNHLHEIIQRFELGNTDYKHTPYIMTQMGGHDPMSYLPPPHECEEYIKLHPNRKLDMSKLSPQNLTSWLYGEESVYANSLNFINPEEVGSATAQELNSYIAQSKQREQDAIERALYDKGSE